MSDDVEVLVDGDDDDGVNDVLPNTIFPLVPPAPAVDEDEGRAEVAENPSPPSLSLLGVLE